MKRMPVSSPYRFFRACGWLAAGAMAVAALGAQTPAPRITAEVTSSQTAPLKGSRHPLAQAQFEAGRMPANTRLTGITIAFKLSAAQQADLDALLAAQQNPASPQYHQWLTPDQFGIRFGMAQADLDAVQNWLLQQGFSIDRVARSRNMIHFSGTAGQVERAFSTEMHYYNAQGTRHFAPSGDLQIPAALSPVVLGIHNLDDFRPRPLVVPNKNQKARGAFTSGQTGNVFFAPGDIVTAYDVAPLHGSGYTGTGQSIVVVGQSDIAVADIEAFQSAAGLTTKAPTKVLVPGTGTSTVYSSDETESDLDLEWAGALAPGADVYFVYVGSDSNNGVFDSLIYAIDEKLGNILSVSYGACEPLLNGYSLETVFQQANAQGQTIVAASGDQGSTACFVDPTQNNPPLATQQEVAVNYPASSPNVTAIGGTEIPATDGVDPNTLAQGANYSTYWNYTSGTDIVASLKQYIPEITWNDDYAPSGGYPGGLSATGGGKSSLFAKPAYQSTLTPADNARDVPDISLYASPTLPGYLYCTSDSSSWDTADGQTSSCTSGFRDASSGLLTAAGGTSFAAPVFAGMLALLNQKAGFTSGAGNINSQLYALATSGRAYSAGDIFHDITSGNNNCSAAGSTICNSTNGATTSYAAGTGYDLVTGLGSIDLGNLATAWVANTSTLVGTSTSISASNNSPTTSTNVTFTITVVAASGTVSPLSDLTLQIDGGKSNGGTTITASLSASAAGTAVATYQTSFSTAGPHQIVAQYPGDSTFAASTAAYTVNVSAPNSGKGTFSISASPTTLTVAQGSSGTETITIVPAGGYTGTVYLTFDTSNDNALANLCYEFSTTLNSGQGSVPVTGTSAVQTKLIFDTLPSSCGLMKTNKGKPQMRTPARPTGKGKAAKNNAPNPAPLAIAFAGLLIGFLGRRSRRFSALAGVILLLSIGMAVTACGGGGGGSSTTTTPEPAKGTYTVTLTAQDSQSSAIPAATTQFTFVIQ